ncbi:hypothetical protein H8D83_02200 [Candidatus Woesearchaeota archaeon]|nr:hypothetical protein [Candidatus Woesearchaeota archaeon]
MTSAQKLSSDNLTSNLMTADNTSGEIFIPPEYNILPVQVLGKENSSKSTFLKETNASISAVDNNSQTDFITKLSDRQPRKKERELQWWLGKVAEVKKETFVGELEDLEGRRNIAEFSKSIVPEHNQRYIKVDSQFTYCITLKESFTGGIESSSKLNFFAKRAWKTEYEEHVDEIMSSVFPKNLLNL